MAIRNLIVNGTFDAGASGWSGNDIEANFSESAYIGTNPGNIVSEIDGNSGQTTVMQQTFSVNGPKTSTLNFDAALRTASNSNAGSEGFTVEILDSTGVAIASMSIFPTANALTGFSLPVTFPSAGNYTVRFTELGPDDSLGAIIDDIQLLVCFGGETLISAKSGPKPAKGVKVGDLIDTLRGSKPVRWVGRRRVSHDAMVRDIKLRPVGIAAGALGQGLPLRDLHVSRQHRMLVRSPICQRMFGAAEVFVAAVRLVGLPGISIDMPGTALEYVHILFDEHEVVLANGAPA